METIVITGGAGRIATALRPRLARPGRVIRLLDLAPPEEPLREREEFVEVAVTDEAATTRAFAGARAVIHLGGDPSERPWAELVDTNITGTYVAFESARAAGVQTVFFASSIHCVGYESLASVGREEVLVPRPDTLYGVTKAAGEALGSMYADRFGMTVVAARIMQFGDEPAADALAGSTWLSADDAARLVEATIALTEPGFRIVWGVSANTPRFMPLQPGRRMGFEPQDDASEVFRRRGVEPVPSVSDPATTLLAGTFIDADHPVGEDWTAD
jgi:hypothetical protein